MLFGTKNKYFVLHFWFQNKYHTLTLGKYGPGYKNDIINQVIDYSPNKIQRPKQFKNEDPSTYPMNQTKTLNSWEAMLTVAKNPKTKEDRKIANEYKRMIHKDYYNPNKRELLSYRFKYPK